MPVVRVFLLGMQHKINIGSDYIVRRKSYIPLTVMNIATTLPDFESAADFVQWSTQHQALHQIEGRYI